jgi:short-subunit dehydrogenase
MAGYTDLVVAITGASEGIGRALALALAPDRPRLVLAARDAARLESVAAEARALGADCLVVPGDLGERAACEALVAATLGRYGRLDVLVANAGVTMWTRFDALEDLSVLERTMRINYFSVAWLTHAALPALKASRGRLAVVASVAGLAGIPERTAYAASKHAVVGFMDSLRIELRGTGVSVTVVAPDYVVTKAHERAAGPDGRPLGASPLQRDRVMTAERCAALIATAVLARKRLLITSLRGRLARFIRPFAPGLVDRIAARAIARRH